VDRVALLDHAQHLEGFAGDFWADAVSGEYGDAMGFHERSGVESKNGGYCREECPAVKHGGLPPVPDHAPRSAAAAASAVTTRCSTLQRLDGSLAMARGTGLRCRRR
jgi:hypothetical protein